MKTILLTALFFVAFFTVSFSQTAENGRVSFNEGWLFQKDDPAGAEGKLVYAKIKDWVRPTGNDIVAPEKQVMRPQGNVGEDVPYTQAAFNDTSWRKLNLPHDWGIEGPFDQSLDSATGKLPWAGIGWYRKHFTVDAKDKGKQSYLDFDGAMAYPAIWLNGKFVGGWAYGYGSFRVDLTPYLEFGKDNVIAVRLENPPESSRWYPGSGIYRNTWLVKSDPVHVAHWGTYVTTTDIDSKSAKIKIKIAIENKSNVAAKVALTTWVSNALVGSSYPAASSVTIPAGTTQTVEQNLTVLHPALWSIERPTLYSARTEVTVNGKPSDDYYTVFGIRTIKFDAKEGFLLNGKRVLLKGVCDHHDLGALGSAVNTRALERQLEILKEMGVNAIRTSHNPPAPELLDLADKMGFVVMDEAFDAWKAGKRKNDYHLLFTDWHEIDWRSQLRRDRNHPSVILWSIGNEIGEQRTPAGHLIAKELADIARSEDPTRPITAGANNVDAGYNGFQKMVDVFGYNYKWAEYEKFRTTNPEQPLFGSETESTVSSRGEYFFPVVEDKLKGRADLQVSSYDLYAPPWAWPPDPEFAAEDKYPYVAGEFVWTGFDYLGEPTPYDRDSKTLLDFTDAARASATADELKNTGKITVPSRSSYFGIVDLAGFKKDRFYIYQARWRPELPMAHILPHWNWPERVGQVTPVHVYTSGDEAELFLNGKSLGRKKRGQYDYRLRWDDVVYQPGELKVIAYKDGKKWAEDTVRTTGDASQILLSADHAAIKADGSDLSFITVTIADKNGLLVPRTHNRVNFTISGPGEIVATDNGDATDLEAFHLPSRRAYNGLALVIVRSIKGKPGKITVTATSDGLKAAKTVITTR